MLCFELCFQLHLLFHFEICIYFLILNNYKFLTQHKFNDCKFKKPLPFDFYLPEYNMCIEFDGEQHFKGWHIKTDTDVFDRDTITLMDFKNCSANSCDFIYVLPYSNNEALIEFTAFSPEVWSDHEYQLKFDQYANMHLKGINFSIIGAEQGTIPMVDYKHSATGSGGQILIGTAAGKIKATSGYGFEKMRADAQILSAQFFKQPIVRQKTKNRFKFYDKLLLKVILEDPQEAVRIFGQLFNKIPFPLILKFLYEETNLYQEALIFSKLPFPPFIKRV